MRTFFALLLLIAIARPASADFVAAEAALKRGEYPSAYLACKSEAEVGDAECQQANREPACRRRSAWAGSGSTWRPQPGTKRSTAARLSPHPPSRPLPSDRGDAQGA